MASRFVLLIWSTFILIPIALVSGFACAVAGARYVDDGCNGPDPLTSDCQDAFGAMVIGGAGSIMASALTAVCITIWLRRRESAKGRSG